MIINKNSRPHHKTGFTIIETMVVLAIIAILAAIAIPMFITLLPNYRLKGAAQDLYSSLQSAKMLAIKENGTSTVEFNKDSGTYKRADASVINLNDEYEGSVFYGRATVGPVVTYLPEKVTFNARGMSNAGAVFIQNNKNQYYKIETQASGVILLKKWNGSDYE